MKRLVAYADSDEEDTIEEQQTIEPKPEIPKPEIPKPSVQHSEPPESIEDEITVSTKIFSSVPQPTKKKKKKKKRTIDIVKALNIDLNSMLKEPEPEKKEEDEITESKNDDDYEPKFDEGYEEEDFETIDEPDEPQTKKRKVDAFEQRTPPRETPEIVSENTSLREGSDFMKKFDALIAKSKQETKEKLQTSTTQQEEPQQVETKPSKKKEEIIIENVNEDEIEFEVDPSAYAEDEPAPMDMMEQYEQYEKMKQPALVEEKVHEPVSYDELPDKDFQSANVINVSSGVYNIAGLEQRRQMLEKHAKEIYSSQATIPDHIRAQFTNVQKQKHQLLYMAFDAQKRQLQAMETHRKYIKSKKDSWKKYGW